MEDLLSAALPKESSHGSGIEDPTSQAIPSQDAEIDEFRAARVWRSERLAQTQAKIEALEAARDQLLKEIAALDILLGDETDNPAHSVAETKAVASLQYPVLDNPALTIDGSRRPRQSTMLMKSVDAVVEILQQSKQPLHYRVIYDAVSAQGIEVTGKDPAAVLLARFSRDPRLERIGNGVYRVVSAMSPGSD